MIYLLLIPIFALTFLMCWQESKKRKIHFIVAVMVCILITPLFGYFFIISRPLRNPIGCKHCGNRFNEAEFCGICGKNSAGSLRSV